MPYSFDGAPDRDLLHTIERGFENAPAPREKRMFDLLYPPREGEDFSMAHSNPALGGKSWRQTVISSAAMATVAEAQCGNPDTYATLNTFQGGRKSCNLSHMLAAWADLDYYNQSKWAGSDSQTVARAVLRTLGLANQPLPSTILSSGRGLLVIWFHLPLRAEALPRWKTLQIHLSKVLFEFGPDSVASPVTSVFRIPGTINSKCGQTARVIWMASAIEANVRHDFGALCDACMPRGNPDIGAAARHASTRKPAARGAGNVPVTAKSVAIFSGANDTWPAKYSTATYALTVIADLHRLRCFRHPGGKLPPGNRNHWMVAMAAASAWQVRPPELLARMISCGRDYADWRREQVQTCISSVLQRASEAALFNSEINTGKPVDPRYRYGAASLVNLLQITRKEMIEANLKVLVDDNVKRLRQSQRQLVLRGRRGQLMRLEYLGKQNAIALDAGAAMLTYLQELGSVAAVAKYLNISVSTAKKRIQRARRRCS